MANKQRNAERERLWRRAIKRQAASGLSVRAFCRREGLTEPNFYAWRRTIAHRDAEGERLRPAARTAKRKRQLAAFVPVVLREGSPREAGIVLELAQGRRLRLPEGFAVERLAQLLRALEADPQAEEAAG